MYSVCIMNNAFDTQSLVSPAEVSTNVIAMANYNFDAHNVTAAVDQYWDPNMKSDLTQLSHVSYGTLLLNGKRKATQWKDTKDSRFAVLGNRGVQNGDLAQNVYNNSRTLQIHGAAKQWEGNVCFQDNHVNFENKFQPDGIQQFTPAAGGAAVIDNIFKDDPEATTGDSWLTVCKDVTGSPTSATFNITWD